MKKVCLQSSGIPLYFQISHAHNNNIKNMYQCAQNSFPEQIGQKIVYHVMCPFRVLITPKCSTIKCYLCYVSIIFIFANFGLLLRLSIFCSVHFFAASFYWSSNVLLNFPANALGCRICRRCRDVFVLRKILIIEFRFGKN